MRAARTLLLLLTLCLAAGLPACSLYRADKCFVPPEQYEDARALYIETGSLEIVQRRMEEKQWRICIRNEVTYRLQKEFQVLPEEIEPVGNVAAQAEAANATN
jgi:hypothetical protein